MVSRSTVWPGCAGRNELTLLFGVAVMSAESITSSSLKDFERNLAVLVGSVRTIEEIEAWIRSQSIAKAVRLEDYYLKSNPPQREFVVQFNAEDGTTVSKVVNVFDLGNAGFRFHEIRDE